MRIGINKLIRVAGAVVLGATLLVGVSASPASADSGCTNAAFYCIKTQKFADNLTGADIGLAPIAQTKYTNYTDTPTKHKFTVQAGKEIAAEVSGDLTFEGSVGIAKVETALGLSTTLTRTTAAAQEVEVEGVKPGQTFYLECFGYYAKYEVALYQRVPGPNNDVLVGARYFYPPVQDTLYCRSRKK